MARTLISAHNLKTPYIVNPGDLSIQPTPSDATNGNYIQYSGDSIYILIASPAPPDAVWNATQTFTVGQVVSWNAPNPISFFQCIQTNSGQQPDLSPTYWSTYVGESFTLVSTPDAFGRLGDLTYTVAMRTNAVVQIPSVGWIQSDSTVWVNPSSARLLTTVVVI